MRESRFHISNKSFVALKVSLLVALLIGLGVFVASAETVSAPCPECTTTTTTTTTSTTTTTISECTTDEDCDDDNPCTEDECVCSSYCTHTPYPESTTCEADDDLCTVDHCDGEGNCVKDYDKDCSHLDDDYCEGTEIWHDEGLCNSETGECYASSTLVQDCYCYNEYCDGDELWYEEGYCDPSGPVCDSTTGLKEDCYYYNEYCDYDKRMSNTGYCNDQKDACDSTIAEIEDCSDYDDDYCEDTYYKVHYTESCYEENDETQCLPASSIIDCRDEYWCNGQEYCVDNDVVYCEAGIPVDCDDSDECTYDNCIEDGYNTGHCENPHMDETPPETTKTYGIPRYPDDEHHAKWITSDTLITLNATDTCTCASGVKETKYKVKLVSDEYCENPNEYCKLVEDGDWQTYVDPFTIDQESCHIIEYYSIDNADNEEDIQHQCVFVDNKPPETVKEVGEFKLKWDGKDSYYYPDIGEKCWSDVDGIECWIVTTDTQISMECIDQEPHPVSVKELCYRVELDGNDKTEDYCDVDLYEGWCCIDDSTKDLVFKETSEHELEFYCVDELDHVSEIDIEKFKVVELEEFEIKLNFKWNLISVPFVLLNDDPEEVFKDVKEDVLLVLAYDAEDSACVANGGWCIYIPKTDVGTIEKIKPGWGYWVLTNKSTYLTVVGISFEEGKSLVSRSVVEGWNLIGYYGTEGLTGYYGHVGGGRQAFCALHSLVNEYNDPKWDALITYWNDFIDLDPYCDDLDPGAGYWVGMNAPDPDYRYATGCAGNPC